MSQKDEMVKQCRKPTGALGLMVAENMNINHLQLWQWGFSMLDFAAVDSILDIGCGSGATIKLMAELAREAKLTAIDYSPDMVEMASKTCYDLISAGRVAIVQSEVSKLCFDDASFELATAFETYYFWPNLVSDLKEINRILKPAGMLLLVNECYRDPAFDERNSRCVRLAKMQIHAPIEYEDFLNAAGFRLIKLQTVPEKNWIAALAVKK